MSSGPDWMKEYQVVEATTVGKSAPPKKSMTRVYKTWLWFRFVLMTFAICCVFGIILLAVAAIGSLFNAGDIVLGVFLSMVLVSFGAGTLWYVLHRLDHKSRYRDL